ncbi:fibroblast growth factor 8b-like isoform X2 [Apostichopus japonicus]|uniref:fibroblast growth factor 8b-like isoform X2 n=1 Tax=Stichopus japonicus TaxID=307972 RepID=UPI003AB1CD90
MLLRLPLLSILLHVVLWCICIQRSRQVKTAKSNMPSESLRRMHGTPSLEEVCLQHEASNMFLRIRGRALVDAAGESGVDDTRLIIETVSLNGSVSIRGKYSNFYLCVNKRGDIVGRKRMKIESSLMCVFIMHNAHGKIELEPLQFTDMYIGFRRDGSSKNARRVRRLSKYSLFVKDTDCEVYGSEERRIFGDLLTKMQRMDNPPTDTFS